MKKNYFVPSIKVQTIALQNMIAESGPSSGTGDGGETGEGEIILSKDKLLDGLFE